jgi:PAS domain S-box-containing protein
MRRTPWLSRYGVALMVVIATVSVLYIPGFGQGLGSLLFVAVLVSAWYGGLGPGLLAATLFALIGLGALVWSGVELSTARIVALLLYLACAVIITLLVEALHAARRRAESSQQWLTAVLSSIGDAVIATDGRGRVNFMNPVAESLCGRTQADAAGEPLGDVFRIVHEPTRVPDEDPVARVLAEGAVVGLAQDTVLLSHDGTERPIDDSGAPIRNARGQVAGAVLVFRDITERKRAEAALVEESRRKDEFLAMLAHELRNPLAAIANSTHLLLRPGAEHLLDWCKEVIDRQVKHLARLVDDLLDVSRITRGKIQLRPQPVDLATLIRSATAAVQPLFDERKHDLRVQIEPGSIALDADPTRLEQVLVNLLTNAAKYTEPGGRIEMTARRQSGRVLIQIRDNGIGIAPELIPRVFELFSQGDRTLARSEGGLGIGLTMVAKLVEMHGGTVTVASEGPGRGSTFTVELPARVTESPSADAAPAATKEPARTRILIVDDNADLTQSLARLLRLLGHEVETAYDGPAGVEAARAFRPQFILLDIGLPSLDGYQVVGQLRRDATTKQATIIAITGYGQEEDRQRALAAGFDHHLAKPVDHNTLISLLQGTH